jgi:hypothetical protein
LWHLDILTNAISGNFYFGELGNFNFAPTFNYINLQLNRFFDIIALINIKKGASF